MIVKSEQRIEELKDSLTENDYNQLKNFAQLLRAKKEQPGLPLSEVYKEVYGVELETRIGVPQLEAVAKVERGSGE